MSLGFYRHLQYCLVMTDFLILLRFVKRPIQTLYLVKLSQRLFPIYV